MPAVNATNFISQGKFKKFACIDLDLIQDELNQAECFDCPRDIWGEFQVRGIMLMTAHRLAMDLDDTAISAGQAAQVASGQAATPRQIVGGFEQDELGMTTYGREFMKLRDRIAVVGARLI